MTRHVTHTCDRCGGEAPGDDLSAKLGVLLTWRLRERKLDLCAACLFEIAVVVGVQCPVKSQTGWDCDLPPGHVGHHRHAPELSGGAHYWNDKGGYEKDSA